MELNEPFENEDEVDGLDLTPRQAPPVRGGDDQKRKRLLVGGFLAVLVVVLGVVAWQGLSNAALYFRTADEAVEQRDELGDRRFRIEGTVVPGSVEPDGVAVRFVIESNDVQVAVAHQGDPPDLFQEDIPVVLEGRWSQTDDVFESDGILVKHTEEYEADNPDRTDEFVGDE
ncbi:cytochrome c maturation protein CcmE [Actinospongicola halichondriae]|uniref:cytochrome c maturation protein CcmE n=1 Tax=Actinospongicola halichondriae TaxID=3236844 RepID=UPI003D417507